MIGRSSATPWLVLLWLVALVGLAVPGVAAAQGVGRFVSPGPLAEPHAHLEGITNCAECHAIGQGIAPDKCMSCHDNVATQVRTGRGFHSDKGQRCGACHPDHLGRDYSLIRLEVSTFDHDQTGFPLRGAHGSAECVDCHGEGDDYTGLDQACRSCHDSPHGVDQSKRKLLPTCETCHQTLTWDALPLPAKIFDHTDPRQTDYILEHEHVDVECRECHDEMRFVPTAFETCESCHADPHRSSFGGATCESCHPTPRSWEVDDFNHDRTRFALRGQHASVTCEQCHGDDPTAPLPFGTCSDCHGDPHGGQFAPRDCEECHTVEHADFVIPEFDHDATGFSLTGEHQYATCVDCHGSGTEARYTGIGKDCDTCHEDAHDGRYEPVPCARCHDPAIGGFREPEFDHADTNFPHTGAHVGLECTKCHQDNNWTALAYASCNDCHFRVNPHRQHMSAESCDECHVTTSFATISFDHVAGTGFDLAPAHTELTCGGCHEDVRSFQGLEAPCTSCHALPSAGHYAGECGDCHESVHWIPGGLGGRDHEITGFALHGAHDRVPCESCHTPGDPYGVARPACVDCHGEEDPHMHLLGDTCGDCHAPYSWYRTRFRHGTTGWPLRGSHRLAECIDCHATGYVGTPTQCWRCHEAEASLLIPAHQSAYLPLCDTCHRPYTWAVQNYPH